MRRPRGSLRRASTVGLAAVVVVGGLGVLGRDARVRWRGDFETGTFAQWTKVEAVAGGARMETANVRQGAHAARFTVRPGDVPGRSGERSELVLSQALTAGYEGIESWYAWSTFFPSDLNPVPSSTANIFTQWHETNPDGCHPNLTLLVNTKRPQPGIRLHARGGMLDSSSCAPGRNRSWDTVSVAYDRWYDFVLGVRWSPDPRVGFVELWIDGKRVVPRTAVATLYDGQGVYMKQGFYRGPSERVSTIVHDGARRGTSFGAVRDSGA